jgi:hypothetical protein
MLGLKQAAIADLNEAAQLFRQQQRMNLYEKATGKIYQIQQS